MLLAAWPQNTDTAKVRMQDAYSADRGSPQPPIPNTTSPRTQNIYMRQQRLLLILRASTRESPVRAWGGKLVAGGYGWSGAWQCLRLLKITTVCRLLALSFLIRWKSYTTCKKQRVRPSPRLILPRLRSMKQSHWRFRSTGYVSAAARLDRMGETGVFPCWD